MTSTRNPTCILVLSGKRKSGKDYLADLLLKRLGYESCQVLRLSGPLKKQYAEEKGLDYKELLNSSKYKESYRAHMIKWGEDKRNLESYFFCRKTVEAADILKPLWIISDARRKTDINFFREHYPDVVTFVRIEASESVRQQRGFVFTKGVDDAESECGLDTGIDWDIVIQNDNDEQVFNTQVEQIEKHVNKMMNR
ncbi:phosphomevalonate kinase-like isoform X2 [Ruditapes philippinarum]|uniref:phosphomevalonate kinase-like isoform X2 n=1 Tax=Ruditapes philippinarum TaxID=129788 RepID=UPI00295B8583|nr:phosphomevalonate kinase-like isoform X2 [Ruditapes philippinarum]